MQLNYGTYNQSPNAFDFRTGSNSILPASNPASAGVGLAPTIAQFSDPLSAGLNNAAGGALNVQDVNTGGLAAGIGAIGQPQGVGANIGGMFKNTFLNENGGLNLGNITDIVGAIGGIYGAMKSYGLAKDQLGFQKQSYETNLKNSTQSYNTALQDRARARAAQEGTGKSYADKYYNENKI